MPTQKTAQFGTRKFSGNLDDEDGGDCWSPVVVDAVTCSADLSGDSVGDVAISSSVGTAAGQFFTKMKRPLS